jgi:hypothetical protein
MPFLSNATSARLVSQLSDESITAGFVDRSSARNVAAFSFQENTSDVQVTLVMIIFQLCA